MKKKITVIALVACLLTILVGTSLAYFMDTDEATNTFTVGSVEIEQKEVFDDNNAQLLPVVNEEPTDGDNYIQKKVTVENTGINGAYVQTFVAVPESLVENGVLKLWDKNDDWVKEPMGQADIAGENVKYTVYRYRYQSELAAEDETSPCLEYVYIDSKTDINVYRNDETGDVTHAYFVMDNDEITAFDATGKLNVYVVTQAVQSKGFADADTALDKAFAKHPWA